MQPHQAADQSKLKHILPLNAYPLTSIKKNDGHKYGSEKHPVPYQYRRVERYCPAEHAGKTPEQNGKMDLQQRFFHNAKRTQT